MTCHLSVSFLGRYKPAHWQGETLAECKHKALADINDVYLKDVIGQVHRSMNDRYFRPVSFSAEGYTPSPYVVSMAKRPRETFLDESVKDLPLHPRISYRNQEQ